MSLICHKKMPKYEKLASPLERSMEQIHVQQLPVRIHAHLIKSIIHVVYIYELFENKV